MSKFINKHKYILLALLVYLMGLIIDKNQSRISRNDIDIDKFEQILHSKENSIQTVVDSLEVLADNYQFNIDIKNEPIFTPEQLDYFEKEGFSFLIYHNDTLKYWTDNLFDVSKIYDKNEFIGRCVYLPDYWLDITVTEVQDYIIIGAYRIKTEYQKQNKYLKNNFQEDLNLPNTFKISLIPLSYGIDVKSSDDEYLLSLIPNNNVFTEYKYDSIVGFLYLLGFFLLVIYLNCILKKQIDEERRKYKVLVSLGLIVTIRLLMLIFKFPVNVYTQSFFDSQYFAISVLFPSLGDLFLNLITAILVSINLFKLVEYKHFKSDEVKMNKPLGMILAFIGASVFLLGLKFISDFIINSNIPLNIYYIIDLNIYSFLGFINIILVIVFSVFVFYKLTEYLFKSFDKKQITVFFSIGNILALFVCFIVFKQLYWAEFIILLGFNIVFVVFLSKKNTGSLYFLSVLSLLSAIIISFILINSLSQKQEDNYALKAVELTNEKDDVAELLLNDIVPLLGNDQTLQSYAENPNIPNLETEVEKFLRRRYFKTYWNKYDISVEFCSDMINDPKESLLECNVKYSNLFQNNGEILNWPNVYFISYSNGKTSYVIKEDFSDYGIDSSVFYITLSPKLYPANIGYPELLLDESVEFKTLPDYSYAKYENDEIALKSGDYDYPLNGKKFFSSEDNVKVIEDNKYKHVVYTLSAGNYIVLTYKQINFINSLITFAYIFLVLVILSGLALLLVNFKSIIKSRNLNFRTKLILSMLGILTVSFSLVGIVTVLLNVQQYEKSHEDDVIEKLHQINIALEQYYNGDDTCFYNNIDDLSNDLRHLAETYGTDINLYDSSGFLISTSRPEIYSLKLIGNRASAKALFNIKHNSFVQFILNEKINLLKFSSAYSQFVDSDNQLKAIINMPYFTNPDEIKSEISNLIISIVNIYVLLFVIAMIISVLISEQIISPLIVLQSSFTKLDLGKMYEKIEYKRKDEIGQLVDEYNKMVDKLRESIDKLSKSERESAWRDMAKQIAHEIKNPLTPMKLSIQLLMRSWDNQDEDFDKRIRDVSSTLINQIETLRRIAEEFSDFAKMPKPQESRINLANKIEEICKLYENIENVEVIARLQNYREAIIYADEKQISRALINLIKNGIQAIADGVYGKIIIDLDVYGEKSIVKVIDNGTGIADDVKEKLFVPSFTTKSSGMGLGLAMVKNIVDNARGKISFKSELGKGTTFILEFPLYKEEEGAV